MFSTRGASEAVVINGVFHILPRSVPCPDLPEDRGIGVFSARTEKNLKIGPRTPITSGEVLSRPSSTVRFRACAGGRRPAPKVDSRDVGQGLRVFTVRRPQYCSSAASRAGLVSTAFRLWLRGDDLRVRSADLGESLSYRGYS